MPRPTDPSQEYPSTYVVQDRSNREEMKRLEDQDKLLNNSMGGVLPEQADPTIFRQVLDVGCGTGNWLIETARCYPQIETLTGVDISNKMLAYARTQAETHQAGDRVQFQMMDALQKLDFPNASFDLVNQRAGASWIRTWEWKDVFVKYHRVTRPGGIIRITECSAVESNSPALTRLYAICMKAIYNSGRFFKETSEGLTGELADLMTRYAVDEVQTRAHTLVYRAGTPEWQLFYEDMARGFRTGLPFYEKWTNVPGDYQEIYQQALKEMQQPDFVATWPWLTAWGVRPRNGQPI